MLLFLKINTVLIWMDYIPTYLWLVWFFLDICLHRVSVGKGTDVCSTGSGMHKVQNMRPGW